VAIEETTVTRSIQNTNAQYSAITIHRNISVTIVVREYVCSVLVCVSLDKAVLLGFQRRDDFRITR
jgi:hypothetical protein